MSWHASDGPPCRFVEPFLNEAAHGTSKGWRRWYALAHAARCTRCATYLKRLEETIARLKAASVQTPSESVLNRLEALIPSEADAGTA